MSDTKIKTKTLEEILAEQGIESSNEKVHKLILWNDDHNSFQWVETCLVAILGFSPEKAQSTAWEVHLKGKSIIKNGSKEELLPFKQTLQDQGLTLTIEKG